MKKLSFIPIAAFFLAVVFSAFTSNTKQIKHDDPLWYYTLPSSTGEDVPSNYVPYVSGHEECTNTSGVRCIIEAPVGDEPDEPDLDNITDFTSYKL